MPGYIPVEQRFWSKVDIRSKNECWNWIGGKNSPGYGRFRLPRQRKSENAHKFIYEWLFGKVPKGMCVCHTCNNRACVNPRHLYCGTPSDNMKDRVKDGTQSGGANKGEKHHMNKFSKDTIDRVKTMLLEGHSGKEISDKFGISRTHISRIKKGKNWV